jgi:hypothetical protein
MNLFSETGAFVAWLLRLTGVFLRARPLTTLTLVGGAAVNRVTSILSFVLPIKIIAVVASSNFSGITNQWLNISQNTLIGGLTAAAVLSLVLSIVSDALAERMAAQGGATVLENANKLAVGRDDYATAQAIYGQYGDVCSGVLFVLVGFAAIAVVEPLLVAFIAGAAVLGFCFTALAVKNIDAIEPNALARYISSNTKDYLDIHVSLNILLALAVLAYPFMWGSGDNVINALLSFVVLRRVLRAASGSVRDAVKMVKRRPITDALFFASQGYIKTEAPASQTLRSLFSKQVREARGADILDGLGINCDHVTVDWRDSGMPGFHTMTLEALRNEEKTHRYHQQIYLPKQSFRLDNEAVLFEHVTRARLAAPVMIARYDEGPFACQICDIGNCQEIGSRQWSEAHNQLFQKLITIEPPRSLVRTYRMSHPLLADRLSDEFITRLEIALDTPDQARCLDALVRSMPEIRARIWELPLYIHNPEIKPANVLVDADQQPLVMTWGKWALEPIGYGLSKPLAPEALESTLEQLHTHRNDLPADYASDHIELARQVSLFEKQINDNQFKQALGQAELLLENPLTNEIEPARANLVSVAKSS